MDHYTLKRDEIDTISGEVVDQANDNHYRRVDDGMVVSAVLWDDDTQVPWAGSPDNFDKRYKLLPAHTHEETP